VTVHAGDLRRRRPQRSARVGAVLAGASTLLLIGLVIWLVPKTSGWPQVHRAFFNGKRFKDSFPKILSKFTVNLRLFAICELAVLVLGLLIAVVRNSQSPALFPFRLFAAAYTDLMRGVPMILMLLLFGFGIPALGFRRPWNGGIIWGSLAIVLVYSAYVAEVFRAGIESIHPSQIAGARSLGLSRAQAMRHVVLPQAVRRVLPPLLNDFISLQKDTALLQTVGVIEAVRVAQAESSRGFNFTPYMGATVLFIALTIPLTRLTDWLIARERQRQQ
jgi:polar amino acid transport system permease protein